MCLQQMMAEMQTQEPCPPICFIHVLRQCLDAVTQREGFSRSLPPESCCQPRFVTVGVYFQERNVLGNTESTP